MVMMRRSLVRDGCGAIRGLLDLKRGWRRCRDGKASVSTTGTGDTYYICICHLLVSRSKANVVIVTVLTVSGDYSPDVPIGWW